MSTQNDIVPLSDGGKSSRKVILPAVALMTSLYYSFSFTTAIVLGYFASRLFCRVMGIDEHNGRKVLLDIGKWKIHLHHWIMGIMGLALVWVIDYFYLPTFFAGFIVGIIIQDIYDYSDWHRVLIRNTAKEKVKS